MKSEAELNWLADEGKASFAELNPMSEPTKKAPEMEVALTEMFGFDRRVNIIGNRCCPKPIGCGGPAERFRDPLSEKEYRISGLCQKCQDDVFGGGDND